MKLTNPTLSETNSKSLSDAELVASLKKGEIGSADLLFKLYAPSLYNYIYYHTGNHFLAEDLCSETITRVIEKIGSYTQREIPLRTWVFRIAQNMLVDHFRRGQRHPAMPFDRLDRENSPEVDHANDWSGTASGDMVEQLAQREELVRAIATLPEEQRTIFLLRFVEGFDLEEVGKLLGKSMASIKSLQYRAVKNLRRELKITLKGG